MCITHIILFVALKYYTNDVLWGKISQETHILQVMDTFHSLNNNLSELFGVIGPNGPAAAKFWVPIFQRSNLLTVSTSMISD